MRVIKRGTLPGERVWIGKCGACGSMAEAVESELTRVQHMPMDGGFAWESCPVCNAGSDKAGYGGMCFHPMSVDHG